MKKSTAGPRILSGVGPGVNNRGLCIARAVVATVNKVLAGFCPSSEMGWGEKAHAAPGGVLVHVNETVPANPKGVRTNS
jgi:hypothetical protein